MTSRPSEEQVTSSARHFSRRDRALLASACVAIVSCGVTDSLHPQPSYDPDADLGGTSGASSTTSGTSSTVQGSSTSSTSSTSGTTSTTSTSTGSTGDST